MTRLTDHCFIQRESDSLLLEWHASSVPFFDDLVTGIDKSLIGDGFITVPDSPGIGIDLDTDQCRRYAVAGEPFFERERDGDLGAGKPRVRTAQP